MTEQEKREIKKVFDMNNSSDKEMRDLGYTFYKSKIYSQEENDYILQLYGINPVDWSYQFHGMEMIVQNMNLIQDILND